MAMLDTRLALDMKFDRDPTDQEVPVAIAQRIESQHSPTEAAVDSIDTHGQTGKVKRPFEQTDFDHVQTNCSMSKGSCSLRPHGGADESVDEGCIPRPSVRVHAKKQRKSRGASKNAGDGRANVPVMQHLYWRMVLWIVLDPKFPVSATYDRSWTRDKPRTRA